MSSSIWTRCAGSSELRALALRAYRAVEAQHIVATRKLVDSDEEQRVLEELLETSKPPLPAEAERLHYLLFTPLRYPPLRHGSRFGTRRERGIWYGSETPHSVFAEVAYYRLVFLEGTEADLSPLMVELSLFHVSIRTEHGIDLTAPPFDAWREVISSKTDYSETQALGYAMRDDGVEAFRYPSARDARSGVNVAVFAASAFAEKRPRGFQSWLCVATREAVEFSVKEFVRRRPHRFERAEFEVDGELPAPAV